MTDFSDLVDNVRNYTETDYTFYRSIVSYQQDLSSIQVPLKYIHTKARLERSD